METINLTQSEEELRRAKQLVYETYLKMGYVSKNNTKQSISEYLHQPQSSTIIACHKNKMVGTISLVQDGPKGMPMDQIFCEELKAVREKSEHVAEVCQLAVDKEASLKVTAVMTQELLSHVVFTAKHYDVDTLVFAVNPKHNSFYKLLGCTPFGEEKVYPSANNNPACAFKLDLNDFKPKSNSFLRDILLKQPSEEFIAKLT